MSVTYLTHAHASVIWGMYSSKIIDGVFDAGPCVSYLGVYIPKIFDGHTSIKYLGGLHPQNI